MVFIPRTKLTRKAKRRQLAIVKNNISNFSSVNSMKKCLVFIAFVFPQIASVDEYPKPDVILLDLGLPKIDGIEVLERVKSEEKLKDIPVVVLTASESGEDIIKTYEGGVKSYILKSTFFAKKKGKMEGLLDTIFSLIR